MRNIGFSQKAFKDLHAWAIRDKKTFDRIHDLILESARDPFKGKGKPEPLRHQFKGFCQEEFLTNTVWFMQLTTIKY